MHALALLHRSDVLTVQAQRMILRARREAESGRLQVAASREAVARTWALPASTRPIVKGVPEVAPSAAHAPAHPPSDAAVHLASHVQSP